MSTWKEASEGNFPVYPSGTYMVKCSSVKKITSAKKQTPGIQFTATVTAPDDYTGRMISVTVWKGAEWRLPAIVEAFGVTGVPENLDMDIESNDVLFQVCEATVGCSSYWRNEQGMYEGKPKNEIVDFQPDPDQAVVQFNTDGDVPDFARS